MRTPILVAILIASLSFAPQVDSRQGHEIAISGSAVDAQTGQGIPHAHVKLSQLTRNAVFFQGASKPLANAFTDLKGQFRFVTTSPGPFEVSCLSRARRMGFAQVKRPRTTGIVIYCYPLNIRKNQRPNQAMQRTAGRFVRKLGRGDRSSEIKENSLSPAVADLVSR
jgi:hypothetical protein